METRSRSAQKMNAKWKKLRKRLRLKLDHYPLAKSIFGFLWRNSRYYLAKVKGYINCFFIGLSIDIEKTYLISPGDIVYSSLKEFNFTLFKGRVFSGHWDLLTKRFEDLDIHHAIKEVCLEGKNWEETFFYKNTIASLERGGICWGCENKDEFNNRCRSIEKLFLNIKNEGYKSQKELMDLGGGHTRLRLDDEIIVAIGRHGDLLFSDSAHRLSIAKCLGIKEIPVKVAVRHVQWVLFRKQLLSFAQANPGKKTYQPLLHSDLADIPAFHNCEDRFSAIKNNLAARGKLLDIGANLGYFSHAFEKEGFDCIAVEMDRQILFFLEKLKRAQNRKFLIISESILDWPGVEEQKFQVVLALNIFHHFLKNETDYNKFLVFLRKLKVKEMFFEPHVPEEEPMKDAYLNLNNSEFVNLIQENTGLKNSKFIYQAADKRKIYKLWR